MYNIESNKNVNLKFSRAQEFIRSIHTMAERNPKQLHLTPNKNELLDVGLILEELGSIPETALFDYARKLSNLKIKFFSFLVGPDKVKQGLSFGRELAYFLLNKNPNIITLCLQGSLFPEIILGSRYNRKERLSIKNEFSLFIENVDKCIDFRLLFQILSDKEVVSFLGALSEIFTSKSSSIVSTYFRGEYLKESFGIFLGIFDCIAKDYRLNISSELQDLDLKFLTDPVEFITSEFSKIDERFEAIRLRQKKEQERQKRELEEKERREKNCDLEFKLPANPLGTGVKLNHLDLFKILQFLYSGLSPKGSCQRMDPYSQVSKKQGKIEIEDLSHSGDSSSLTLEEIVGEGIMTPEDILAFIEDVRSGITSSVKRIENIICICFIKDNIIDTFKSAAENLKLSEEDTLNFINIQLANFKTVGFPERKDTFVLFVREE